MGDDKNQVSDADLLAALNNEKPESAAPGSMEYVQRLIKMNPAMKPVGMSTEQTAEQLSVAIAQAKQNAAGKSNAPPAKSATPRAAAVPQAVSPIIGEPQGIGQAIDAAKRQLHDEQQALVTHQAELRTRIEQCEKEIAAIETKKSALPTAVCDKFIDRVLAIDRQMTSPKTQASLRAEHVFLTSIGFSVERLIAREKKR